jgi:superfamily II DNA or RNA helicase
MDLTQQLIQGAERLLKAETFPAYYTKTSYRLRMDQLPVFQDFATYLQDIVTRPEVEMRSPYCRIILPPRTGKTVIAGHIIAMTGLPATVVVPTRALVIQTVKALNSQLNGTVPIGVFYGREKCVVDGGTNIITYNSLQRHSDSGTLPGAIEKSALIFVDEAHHSMTKLRMNALNQAFDVDAVRIALTATPQYNDARRLDIFFPDKVHEIDLAEAMSLGLLAPARVWVAEVDAGNSRVKVVAGDFEKKALGRLMSSAPFFKTVEIFRYTKDNRRIPCMIACASRQQAYDLNKYLKKYKPRHHPAPGLILGETQDGIRNQLLSDFEVGKIDTLIQVGVLIEGWDSPHCKLLIDLAPSTSEVRATQKYFRVMTRYRQKEAKIYVILPDKLPRLPVLPMDLLLDKGDEYRCGNIINRQNDSGPLRPIDTHMETPVKGVVVRKRILLGTRLELPELKPSSQEQIRLVIESCPGFKPDDPCIRKQFNTLIFSHPLFTGSGKLLLRWLKVGYRKNAYWMFMSKLYPETTAHSYLTKNAEIRGNKTALFENHSTCREDALLFIKILLKPCEEDGKPVAPFPETFSMLQGGIKNEQTPEQLLLRKEQIDRCFAVMETMDPRLRQLIVWKFGLCGEGPLNGTEIAEKLNLSPTRIYHLTEKSLRTLRFKLKLQERKNNDRF